MTTLQLVKEENSEQFLLLLPALTLLAVFLLAGAGLISDLRLQARG
jgi:hypothetical protein